MAKHARRYTRHSIWTTFYTTLRSLQHLHLSRLVIDHFHPIGDLSRKFHKLLVSWIFVNIIVTVLRTLELDHKSMGVRILQQASAAF